MKIWILCLALAMSLGAFSCQKTEKCVFYVHIYESNGDLVTTLGPFGNEDAATDEANDYIGGEDDYFYRVELKTKSGCRESEE